MSNSVAARDAMPLLVDDGVIVTLPNGLPELLVGEAIPGVAGRVIGGIVGFGPSRRQRSPRT